MATLKIVGSSSKGNSYIIETSNETLLLELGCKWNEVLGMLDYKIDKIVGVVVSHAHS